MVEHDANGGAFAFRSSLMAIRGEKDNQPDRGHRHKRAESNDHKVEHGHCKMLSIPLRLLLAEFVAYK